jgi:hypothetical protein
MRYVVWSEKSNVRQGCVFDRLTRFKTLPMSILGSTPIDSSLSASRWRCDGVVLLLEADDEAVDDSSALPDAGAIADVAELAFGAAAVSCINGVLSAAAITLVFLCRCAELRSR